MSVLKLKFAYRKVLSFKGKLLDDEEMKNVFLWGRKTHRISPEIVKKNVVILLKLPTE